MQPIIKRAKLRHKCYFCDEEYDVNIEYFDGESYSALYNVREVNGIYADNVVFIKENTIEADAQCQSCLNANRIKQEI